MTHGPEVGTWWWEKGVGIDVEGVSELRTKVNSTEQVGDTCMKEMRQDKGRLKC